MPFEIIRNDITKVKADAIVNTANPYVAIGEGTDRAIYEAAGAEQLLAERAKIGAMRPGQAAVTPAFALDAKYIIHTVGPAWQGGTHGEKETVAECYRNSLRLAEELKCESVAFPLISSGTYGFPKDEALRIAVSEISSFLFSHDMDVYLVVYDKESFVVSGKAFSDIRSFIEDRDVKLPLAQERRSRQMPDSNDYREYRSAAPSDGWVYKSATPSADSEESTQRKRESIASKRKRFFERLRRGRAESAESAEPERLAPQPEEMLEESQRWEAQPAERCELPEEQTYGSYSSSISKDTLSFDSDELMYDLDQEEFAEEAPTPSVPMGETFKIVLPDSAESKYAGSEYSMPEMEPPMPRSAVKPSVRSEGSLEDLLKNKEETFQQKLFSIINSRGLTDPEVYKRANIDRKLFSKIRGDVNYNPSKKTALALSIALGLNLDETTDLLRKSGLSLSPSNNFDIIIKYCIEHGLYDIYEINCLLFKFDQPLLGA